MTARVQGLSLPDDGTLIRWAFYGLLSACVVVLFLDFREMAETDPLVERILDNPIPPAVDLPARDTGTPDAPAPYFPSVQTKPQTLRQNLEIRLAGDNRLELTGTIDPGAAARFEQEIEGIGEYVQTVVLNSPGGSVEAALKISSAIREKQWTTHVKDGGLCASSCPIMFAGGLERTAGKDAAIGVHQIYSVGQDRRSLDQAISGTQHSTATIVRHLEDMGVDPNLWTHALETPPANLYYFRPEELEAYKLVSSSPDNS